MFAMFASEMTRKMILIDSIQKIKNFNSIMQQAPLHADLKLDKYVVDAASILGIYSIDTIKPIELRIHGQGAKAEAMLESIKDYIVGEAPILSDPYEKERYTA